jgi:molecular chaperone Hsp33
MTDHLVKATAAGGRIRAVAVRTTGLVEEARQRHEMAPTAAAALGKALTGGLLLASTVRKQGRLNVRIAGGGPIGGIFVDAGTDGTVRGYVGNPVIDLPPNDNGHLNVGGVVGQDGTLSVTYDLGVRPYSGTVQLVSGELGQDFAAYLGKSEQIPSAVSLGIWFDKGKVQSAGGFIVQLMPDAGDEIAERLEQAVLNAPFFTEMEMKKMSLTAILERVLQGFAVEILQDDQEVQFSCHCNEERVLNAIRMLGEDEIRDMIQTDGKAEVRCHFCNEQYLVPKDELERLVS